MRFRRIAFVLFIGCAALLSAAEDREVFENHCASCHGVDGRAHTPQGRKLKARDLSESKKTDEEIVRQIRAGSLNKTGVSVMPAVGEKMSDAEIQATVRIVKTFRSPPPAAK